jgi:hypothetical protein
LLVRVRVKVRHMEPIVVARAMAREQWDRQYFSRLR